MNELHLFAGAGGGILGSILLGHDVVGAVEWEEYPCKVLEQRQRDGYLKPFPIFQMDIRDFNRRIAPMYREVVEIVSAGFPCQPWSHANQSKKYGEYDSRNLWPQTIESIRIIRPRFAFLENVPGLLHRQYIGRIFGDLAETGYDARWCVLGGKTVNSACDGKRLWILAYAPNCKQLEGMDIYQNIWACSEASRRWQFDGAVSEMLSQDDYTRIKRDSNVVAQGMDRLKAIGNGQIPLVAANAFRILSQGLDTKNFNYHSNSY